VHEVGDELLPHGRETPQLRDVGQEKELLALAPARLAGRVVAAMEEASAQAGAPARGRVVRVRAAGAQVLRGS